MEQSELSKIREIVSQFRIKGNITEIILWGNGLINNTFRINTDSGTDYLLQQINEGVYRDVDGMMDNIMMVTDFIKKYEFYLMDGQKKQNLSVIRTHAGKPYLRTADNSCYRVYNFMKRSYCMETGDEASEIFKTGLILGQFHYLMCDFKTERMHVIIPDFHNPMVHYENLEKAYADNIAGRAQEVAAEMEFFRKNLFRYDYFNEKYKKGLLRVHVNHNDPKINNIMFDTNTREPICMIDFDTCMPGFIVYDFGDAIRSIMCTGKDYNFESSYASKLNEPVFRPDFYESYLKGFLEGCQNIMTEEEQAGLPMGAALIAFESGMRYLADYLNGNIYFKVRYPSQNLVKTRMHMQLAMELCGYFGF